MRSPRIPRLTFVIGLLVLTLSVAAALAWQAHRAAESHRETAKRVLRDYVQFAGWEFSRAARRELDGTLERWLNVIGCADRDELPAPWALSSGDGCRCDDLTARTLFRLERDGRLVATGEPLAEATRRWIVEQQPRIDRLGPHGRVLRVTDVPGRTTVFAAKAIHGATRGEVIAIAGFLADPVALAPPLASVLANAPLLPPTLVGDRTDIVQVTARVPSGDPILVAPGPDTEISARGRLDDSLAGIEYEVFLNRAAAGQLVIGGLPQSRLPLLVGLLGLTTALLVAAAFQLRRELELATLRADFVSSVSHELRTPLAQIRLFSETLLLGRVRSEAEGRRSLEIIQQESRRLTHLVENVLYFSRSERGTGRLSMAPVALGDLVAELAEAFAPLARAGRSELRLAVHENVTAQVDAGAVRQMLLNLLDNAVKYGRPEQTIVLSLERRGDNVALGVEDEGPGVPEGARDRIWEPYSRLTTAESAAIAGTGIGLAVVRDLAELHGGAARVESAAGGGARFVVELPCAVPAQAQAGIPDGSRAPA